RTDPGYEGVMDTGGSGLPWRHGELRSRLALPQTEATPPSSDTSRRRERPYREARGGVLRWLAAARDIGHQREGGGRAPAPGGVSRRTGLLDSVNHHVRAAARTGDSRRIPGSSNRTYHSHDSRSEPRRNPGRARQVRTIDGLTSTRRRDRQSDLEY